MDFNKYLSETGWINRGDTVYVISDMMPLALEYRKNGEKLDLNNLIDYLKELVGPEGNLLFPAFNWDFCKGIPFDRKNTPCKTGALSKAALKRDDFQRTSHPLYSFAVWGKDAERFMAIDVPESFGPGTIFDEMTSLNAKALVIGIPALSGFTYIHHVEQLVCVPFRYNKNFTADYIDRDGSVSTRTYSMYVRDLDMDPRHIDGFRPLEEIMLKDGVIARKMFGDVMLSKMNIPETLAPIKKDLLENDAANMYRYNHV